jgi:hypothetical protein
MPSANYYREQASLLQRWGSSARDPATAEQLKKRAQEMLELADQRDDGQPMTVDWSRLRRQLTS